MRRLIRRVPLRLQAPPIRVWALVVPIVVASTTGACGSGKPVDTEPTAMRQAISACASSATDLFREAYERIPAASRDVATTPESLTPFLRDLCEQAAIDGKLTAQGSIIGSVMELVHRDPQMQALLCQSGFLAQQEPPDRFLSAEALGQIAQEFCDVWLAEGYAEAQWQTIQVLRKSGTPPREIIAQLLSGKLTDLNKLFGDHPELAIPFLVAEGMRAYQEFTPSEKRRFPRPLYRKYINDLYERAIRKGLLNFDADDPEAFVRDKEAFKNLAEKVAVKYLQSP